MTPVLAYYNPGSPSGFVNDFAGVIDGATKQSLEQKLVNFEKETSNEISVVTINNLGGDYIENFAAELFKEWGVGKENRDNGVLALVAVEDRKMRLEVGYGLEGALTDAQSNWIINNEMKPAFQAGKYGEGISLALESIIKATRGEYVPAEKLPQRKIANFEFIAWAAIFLLMWLAAILGRSKSWWAGGIIGGAAGVILGFIWGFVWIGAASIIGFTIFGSLFDYVVSKKYHAAKASGRHLPWWFGGGGFGGGMSGSGGFGGFGGGMSGGGGSSGSW